MALAGGVDRSHVEDFLHVLLCWDRLLFAWLPLLLARDNGANRILGVLFLERIKPDIFLPLLAECQVLAALDRVDGLARLVQQQFELDPFTNTLFLFCGRRRDRIKGLYWEKDGFILLYKRLEQGAYQWPRSESEVKTLTPQQYRWLMEGLQIEQPKAHRPVTGLTAV